MIYVDASLLKQSSCKRYIYWTSCGWERPGVNYKADFGSAIHKALQYYYNALGASGNNLSVSDFSATVDEAKKKATDFWSKIEEKAEIKDADKEIYNEFHLECVLDRYFQVYRNDSTLQVLE